ncbi:ABC transporter transmembrane domain-containing protein [Staphylococcus felis]|uniref:ABC transporter transmembrane domain-containing protein n=2 Tax=Staphylococcus felis TaxID=46127 RepID=UPI001EE852C1|nr:ABC transporter transmembrane domain-containing protein [Staphylococcus felis]
MDTSKIREALSSSTVTLLVDTLMIMLGGILLFMQSLVLLLITILFIPLFVVLSYVLSKPYEMYNQKVAENDADLSSYLNLLNDKKGDFYRNNIEIAFFHLSKNFMSLALLIWDLCSSPVLIYRSYLMRRPRLFVVGTKKYKTANTMTEKNVTIAVMVGLRLNSTDDRAHNVLKIIAIR